MSWLDFNRVNINFFDKTVMFHEPEESTDSRSVFVCLIEMSLRGCDQMVMMFSSLRVENEFASVELPVVCEFADVFPEDISDFPSE